MYGFNSICFFSLLKNLMLRVSYEWYLKNSQEDSVQWFYWDILLSWLFLYSHPLSKIEVFSFFESGNYVKATRFFTEFQEKCRNFKKIAFDHCKTCSERFVIWRDNFSFIFQGKEDKEMSEKRCYTVQELQEILGVSRPTIYNLLKKKEFRWIQLDGGKYRISKKSFDDWLDNLEQ